MQNLYVPLTCKCLLRSILIHHLCVYLNISYISYQKEQVPFTHYISLYPYFYGLLIFSITYPHSQALRGPWHYMNVCDQSHTPPALTLGKMP